MTKSPRSIAGHVLRTGEATQDEAKALAGAVLGNEQLTPAKPTKTRQELQALIDKIDGVEGQRERADMIRAQLANWQED